MSTHDPHLVDVVRQMKQERVSNAEIAMSVGLTEPQVISLCHRRGIRRPTIGRLEVEIGVDLMVIYQTEAKRRGERFDHFMRKLLQTIALPDPGKPGTTLFSAIFDDGK